MTHAKLSSVEQQPHYEIPIVVATEQICSANLVRYNQDTLLKSAIKKVPPIFNPLFCRRQDASVLTLLTAIDLFNFNYDSSKGKATKSFLPLLSSSGVVFGCQNCYAYAGVTFKFR